MNMKGHRRRWFNHREFPKQIQGSRIKEVEWKEAKEKAPESEIKAKTKVISVL